MQELRECRGFIFFNYVLKYVYNFSLHGHAVSALSVSDPQVKNFAVIYLVDITEVPDFNKMYELYDPCTVMFFFRYE